MLKQRIATAAVLLAVLLATMFWLPNFYWAVLLVSVLIVGAYEWGRLAAYSRITIIIFCGFIILSCATILYVRRLYDETAFASFEIWIYIAALFFWLCVCPVWLGFKQLVKYPLVLAAVGWIILVPTWLALSRLQTTPSLLVAALGVVWVADSAAYLVGRKLGKHKLAPNISPGKTWEGVIAAYCAVSLYTLLLYFTFVSDGEYQNVLIWLMISYGIAALSIEGDLFESWVKRQAGAKDSGKLLPGHGGILDRIDSLTSTMPFVAILLFYHPPIPL